MVKTKREVLDIIAALQQGVVLEGSEITSVDVKYGDVVLGGGFPQKVIIEVEMK